MERLYIDLGRRIRQQRILASMTQECLAEYAGISLSFLGHIEHGTRKASIETLVKISNALGISPTMLLQDSLTDELLGFDSHLSGTKKRLLREVTSTIVGYHDEEFDDVDGFYTRKYR